MKFNKWTLGLAAVGAVSLASAARADEKMSQVQTALSSTTLSGYVDTGIQYGNTTAALYGPTVGPSDSVSLNVVDLALDKPLDDSPWASGYHVELWLGPGQTALGTGGPIRQAYLALATPIGTQSIDWKIGVWDTIIGYEGLTSANNPNYTHSYGFFIEPTTHTGIQGTYQVNSSVSLTAGLADDSTGAGAYSAAVNGSTATTPLLNPTVMGSIGLTAPDSFGALKGATLTVGGMNTGHAGGGTTSLYAGATIPTPNAALKFGASFDYLDTTLAGVDAHAWDAALYSTYQFNPNLSLNLRGEYLYQNGPIVPIGGKEGEEFTATLQYALWANVLTRVEARWDHAEHGTPFTNTGSTGTAEDNALLLAAQLIYTF